MHVVDPGEEMVAIVDERNRVVGSRKRRDMRAEGLMHRATYVFVFDRRDRVFVQKRTAIKDVYPGYFDAAAGGVVLAGETYDESARREVFEELGIEGVELRPAFTFLHEDDDSRVWGKVYTCLYEGPFTFQPEEVESGWFAEVDDVLQGRVEPLTPDTLHALERLAAHPAPDP